MKKNNQNQVILTTNIIIKSKINFRVSFKYLIVSKVQVRVISKEKILRKYIL